MHCAAFEIIGGIQHRMDHLYMELQSFVFVYLLRKMAKSIYASSTWIFKMKCVIKTKIKLFNK